MKNGLCSFQAFWTIRVLPFHHLDIWELHVLGLLQNGMVNRLTRLSKENSWSLKVNLFCWNCSVFDVGPTHETSIPEVNIMPTLHLPKLVVCRCFYFSKGVFSGSMWVFGDVLFLGKLDFQIKKFGSNMLQMLQFSNSEGVLSLPKIKKQHDRGLVFGLLIGMPTKQARIFFPKKQGHSWNGTRVF